MSTPNDVPDEHSPGTHDPHEHGGHGDEHTVPPGEVIAVNSAQDWLLLLVTGAAALALVWYGFQWANAPTIGVESESHESTTEHAH